jgi:4'-phosphopantetheinyl transferase
MTSFNPFWNVPDKEMKLSENEVHVWRASLEVTNHEYSTMRGVLSAEEREHALRFAFEKDRRRWVVAHGVLRMLLSSYLLIDPANLRFSSNPYGKPSVAPPPGEDRLQFNMAHSVDLALYAFSYGQRIGIDVEYMRKNVEYEQLARSYFSPREYTTLKTLPPPVQHEAFYLCWSRKEAYLKGIGKGLSISLATFDVSLVPGEPAALLASQEDSDAPGIWLLYDLAPGVNYAGALAVEGISKQISCWDWQGC